MRADIKQIAKVLFGMSMLLFLFIAGLAAIKAQYFSDWRNIRRASVSLCENAAKSGNIDIINAVRNGSIEDSEIDCLETAARLASGEIPLGEALKKSPQSFHDNLRLIAYKKTLQNAAMENGDSLYLENIASLSKPVSQFEYCILIAKVLADKKQISRSEFYQFRARALLPALNSSIDEVALMRALEISQQFASAQTVSAIRQKILFKPQKVLTMLSALSSHHGEKIYSDMAGKTVFRHPTRGWAQDYISAYRNDMRIAGFIRDSRAAIASKNPRIVKSLLHAISLSCDAGGTIPKRGNYSYPIISYIAYLLGDAQMSEKYWNMAVSDGQMRDMKNAQADYYALCAQIAALTGRPDALKHFISEIRPSTRRAETIRKIMPYISEDAKFFDVCAEIIFDMRKNKSDI